MKIDHTYDDQTQIAMTKKDGSDYTIWRREYFDKMDLEQISKEAAAYIQGHPHEGKGIRV